MIQPEPLPMCQKPTPHTVNLDVLEQPQANQAELFLENCEPPLLSKSLTAAYLEAQQVQQRQHIRSNSEVKLPQNYLAQSPYTASTDHQGDLGGDVVQDDVVIENKCLKQHIAQLQNVIVSMCVLNQRQQSVRTQSTSIKDNHSRSRSDKADSLSRHKEFSNNSSEPNLPQAKPPTRMISSSIKKAVEPRPEHLHIEPVERPALISTMPQDWITDQQLPQCFPPTESQAADEKVPFDYDCDLDNLQTFEQAKDAAVVYSNEYQNWQAEDISDLNNADIDLGEPPKKLSQSQHISTSLLKSVNKQVRGRGRSTAVKETGFVPGYLRNTQSSQAKVVPVVKKSSVSMSSKDGNSGIKLTTQRSKKVSKAMVRSCDSDDSGVEVSICATETAEFLHQKKSLLSDNGRSRGGSHNSSTSKISAKIRGGATKKSTSTKRLEFKELTKRQNRVAMKNLDATSSTKKSTVSRRGRQSGGTSSVTTKKVAKTATTGPTGSRQDRKLFQKTMETIAVNQNLKRLYDDIQIKKHYEKASQSLGRDELTNQVLKLTVKSATSLNSSQKLKFIKSGHHQKKQVETVVASSSSMEQPTAPVLPASGSLNSEEVSANGFAVHQVPVDDTTNATKVVQQIYPTTDEEPDSQEETVNALLDHMANQSPLKSGPSTAKCSVYESPVPCANPSRFQDLITSSVKKAIVPPLNFEKVFEQQKLILHQEELRKKEEEKKLLQRQQQKQLEKAFASASSNKKRSRTIQSSQQSKKSKIVSSQKKQQIASPFEDSPQSKLQYNIKEEVIKICPSTVAKTQQQQSLMVSDFETIVKVDKKTEQKLMYGCIEQSAGKNPIYVRSCSRGGHSRNTSSKIQVNKFEASVDEPVPIFSPPPKAVQPPSQPQNTSQSNIKKSKAKQESRPMPEKLSISQSSVKETRKAQPFSRRSTAGSVVAKKPTSTAVSMRGSVAKPNKVTRCNSTMASISKQQNKQSAAPTPKKAAKRKSVFQLSKAASVGTTLGAAPQQVSKQSQQHLATATIKTPKSRMSSTTWTESPDRFYWSNKASKLPAKPFAKSVNKQGCAKQGLGCHSGQSNRTNTVIDKNYTRVRATMSKTQNLLNSFETGMISQQRYGNNQKRSKSKVLIEELMQPILKQRPQSSVPLAYIQPENLPTESNLVELPQPADIFHDSETKPAVEVEAAQGLLMTPQSCNNSKKGHVRQSLFRSYSRASAKSSNQGYSGKKLIFENHHAPTAFDNADICDIDNQLSLSVKVPIEPPGIVRKSLKSSLTQYNNQSQRHNNSNTKLANQMSMTEQLSQTQTTVNTPSTSNLRPQARHRNSSLADTYSSLSKKRSGILQRQASSINQACTKGAVWKF